jgi:hypothetical protein
MCPHGFLDPDDPLAELAMRIAGTTPFDEYRRAVLELEQHIDTERRIREFGSYVPQFEDGLVTAPWNSDDWRVIAARGWKRTSPLHRRVGPQDIIDFGLVA